MDENAPSFASPALSFAERLRLALAVLFGLACGISCMSINLGSHKIEVPNSNGTIIQEGTLDPVVSPNGTVEIFFPRPYLSSPNLQLSSTQTIPPVGEFVEIIEQKPDHFTLRRKSLPLPPLVKIKWQAEGVPVPLPGQPIVLVPAPEPPPNGSVIIQSGGK